MNLYISIQKEREIAEAEAAGAVMDTKEEIRDEAPILDSQAAEGININYFEYFSFSIFIVSFFSFMYYYTSIDVYPSICAGLEID